VVADPDTPLQSPLVTTTPTQANLAEEPAEARHDASVVAPAPDGADPAPLLSATPNGDAGHRPWRRAVIAGLLTWLLTRLGLALLTVSLRIEEPNPKLHGSAVLSQWAHQWDSGWFLGIAHQGYVPTPDESLAAFFPLYPVLIHVLTPAFFGYDWLAALAVSNAALLVALILICRLAEQEFGWSAGQRTAFYLVAYPTGFFLTAAYNESLFIALLLGSIYAIRRSRWWTAGVLGLLATSTRSAGLVLVLPFCYEYLRLHGRRVRANVLAVALIPLGFLPIMIATMASMHDPLAFAHAQARHWGRHLNWPWVSIYDTARNMIGYGAPATGSIWAHDALELGTVLLLLVLTALAFVGPWRVRRDQYVLPLLGLGLILFMISFPTTNPRINPFPLYSSSRIGLEAVPAFFILGRIGHNAFVDRLVTTAFLTMQAVLVMQFLAGKWVA
jgi:Mannosyltransferase (PIG-V)